MLGNSEIAATIRVGRNSLYDVHSDHLDTPRMLTDNAGVPSWRASYQAFGRAYLSSDPDGTILTTTPPISFNVRFPGQYYDQESGLHYNRFRYYDASTGRYANADPIGQVAGANVFVYVKSNSLNWVDPLGLAPNQAGTTNPVTIGNEINRISSAGGSASEVMTELSSNHIGNDDRYFYTDTYGWVDTRHFGAAAAAALNTNSSAIAEILGFGNEVAQYCTEWGNDYRSGFSPEDVPSNAAGAEFGDDYAGNSGNLQNDFEDWLADVGGRDQDHPVANRSSLPATDPAVRGGKNRGSSNFSSSNPGR